MFIETKIVKGFPLHFETNGMYIFPYIFPFCHIDLFFFLFCLFVKNYFKNKLPTFNFLLFVYRYIKCLTIYRKYLEINCREVYFL